MELTNEIDEKKTSRGKVRSASLFCFNFGKLASYLKYSNTLNLVVQVE